MDNLATVFRIMLKPGEVVPCVRILRGLQIAARQQNATFVIEMSFKYPSGGQEIQTETINVPIKETKGIESATLDPMWCEVMAPAIPLRDKPDHGARFVCNANITITQVSGVVTPCGPIDTQIVEAGW